MKHAELRSLVHNVADSLASGVGLMIGLYGTDVFGEAARSPEGALTVDLLRGAVVEGEASTSLREAVSLYSAALHDRCLSNGGSAAVLREAKVRYWADAVDRYFTVTIEDTLGRCSTTEYAGVPGQRVKIRDALGRVRPKASAR